MTTATKISVNRVDNRSRNTFLPRRVKSFIHFENICYSSADDFSKDYNEASWQFMETSNGSFYIKPNADENKMFTVMVADNYYDGEMSADAFGIVCTMKAFERLMWAHYGAGDEKETARLIDYKDNLSDYISCHPEAMEIRKALD